MKHLALAMLAAVVIAIALLVLFRSHPPASPVPQSSSRGADATSSSQASTPPSSSAESPSKPPVSQVQATEYLVSDARTGLMWTRNDNGSRISWESANRYCNELTLGGYKGWRLPTTEQLKGIYDPTNITGKYSLGGNNYWDIH